MWRDFGDIAEAFYGDWILYLNSEIVICWLIVFGRLAELGILSCKSNHELGKK